MSTSLEFKKGGIVIYNDWVYDEEAGVGQYVQHDITDYQWIHKRDQTVSFDDDVTLNDVFLFLNKTKEVSDIIFTNCFVSQLLKSWAKIDQTEIKLTQEYDPDGIEFLELYWGADLFTYEGVTTISGLGRPDFHGKGFILKEDKTEDGSDWVMYKKGTRIQWGLDFSDLVSLLGLPIKLNQQFEIQEEWNKGKEISELKMLVSCDREYSFQEAIEGIMWELSFYGTDEERMAVKDYVMGVKADLDAGTAELVEVDCGKF